MTGIRGDFTGFTYNGIHSSALGLTRVSSSNRYSDNLAPTFREHIVDVSSGDGKHHYGTDYPKRDISISVAFDGLDERQQQVIKTKWADGEIHELIFDEIPYKVYSAKLENNSVIKHICFSENNQRVYKGEGTIKFVCYFPYAISRFEYQEDYVAVNIPEWTEGEDELEYLAGLAPDSGLGRATIVYDLIDDESETINGLIATEEVINDWPMAADLAVDDESLISGELDNATVSYNTQMEYVNYPEWILSSGIPSNKDYGKFSGGAYKIYNAGDVDVPFQVWFVASTTTQFTISIDDNYSITAKNLKAAENDYYLVFNTDTHSIEGYDSAGEQTGNLYNYCITVGSFFMLPVGEQSIKIEGAQPHDIKFHYWYY